MDISANGFSLVISPDGVDMSNASEFDISDMDYNVYAFTDSAYQHDGWTMHLEEALDQYRENMAKRGVVKHAKQDRLRRVRVASPIPTGSVTLSCADEDESEGPGLIDLRFVS